MTVVPDPKSPATLWVLLLRLRWLIGGVLALAFAAGQLVEAFVFDQGHLPARLLLDVGLWGLLGGLAGWSTLTWVSRQERRYQTALEQSLHDQQRLNIQLQRSNQQLTLLSDVNRRIASSATVDEVLDASLGFLRQLVPTQAAALFLNDAATPVLTRVEGTDAEALPLIRQRFALDTLGNVERPRTLRVAEAADGLTGACVLLPLHDGAAAVGWVELYLAPAASADDDELALLTTIASEIAEAVISARRRSREERAIYELERAIAEERARIARDIHDGIAQTLAFRRMRIDLWLDWLSRDPERLRGELVDLKHGLREQIAELRRAIFALRPVQFDALGFVGGLHRYIAEFAEQQGWEAQINLGGVPAALPPELEATCFRIVQEALTNAAKHAQASRVEIVIDQAEHGLRLQICDNGHGFVPGQVEQHADGRVGLRQMRERLAALRGQLTVRSIPGEGTQVRAWLPL